MPILDTLTPATSSLFVPIFMPITTKVSAKVLLSMFVWQGHNPHGKTTQYWVGFLLGVSYEECSFFSSTLALIPFSPLSFLPSLHSLVLFHTNLLVYFKSATNLSSCFLLDKIYVLHMFPFAVKCWGMGQCDHCGCFCRHAPLLQLICLHRLFFVS